jgi:hypothetical protein
VSGILPVNPYVVNSSSLLSKPYLYCYTHNVPLRDSGDTLKVNWVEVTVTDEAGKQLYQNAFITNHAIDDLSVAALAEAGRARYDGPSCQYKKSKSLRYILLMLLL